VRWQQIVKTIAAGPLGQAQLVKRATQCLTVPGEVWVAIIADKSRPAVPPVDPLTRKPQRWLALSKDEIHRGGRGTELDLPEGGRYEFNTASDSLIRIWNPDPRNASEADSPVRGTLDSLHEIVRTTKTISNASKSRLIGNGVVFVPQEMSLPPVNIPATAGQSGVSSPLLEGTPAVQQLQELLWQVANTAYDDEDSMAALIPMFATVPGDQIKNVNHLQFDNQVTDVALKTRNDAISRLAMGLDVNPERLLGLGTNANHWSAWQIADEDVQLHIAPVMETVCAAIYEQILAPILQREGLDPAKFVLWYDESHLTADPDKTANATAAFTAGAITAEAFRDYLGLDADAGYDYSSLEGWQLWAQDHVSAHPELLPVLAPLLGPITDVVPEIVAPALPPPLPIGGPPPPPPDTAGPPPTEGQPPPTPPAAARAREVQLAVIDLMVGRALELAGKRRRTRSDHNRLRGIPMHETHRYMPPIPEPKIGRLIEGWDAALEDDVLARLGLDSDDLRVAVRRAVRAELTRPMVDA
jgi:hypothetical protein